MRQEQQISRSNFDFRKFHSNTNKTCQSHPMPLVSRISPVLVPLANDPSSLRSCASDSTVPKSISHQITESNVSHFITRSLSDTNFTPFYRRVFGPSFTRKSMYYVFIFVAERSEWLLFKHGGIAPVAVRRVSEFSRLLTPRIYKHAPRIPST